ncbi:hypothetical protein BHE18_02460 [Rossellomorea aquimaris]|uniref:Uncharacterized protein n=1 Tax=Rossellomorea aquimaris TaxID=189382 RepID=A0A1J6WVA0_9BACI|nr:hypothetical protein BHE18_02460 [Rossellomorea aquimaris]
MGKNHEKKHVDRNCGSSRQPGDDTTVPVPFRPIFPWSSMQTGTLFGPLNADRDTVPVPLSHLDNVLNLQITYL